MKSGSGPICAFSEGMAVKTGAAMATPVCHADLTKLAFKSESQAAGTGRGRPSIKQSAQLADQEKRPRFTPLSKDAGPRARLMITAPAGVDLIPCAADPPVNRPAGTHQPRRTRRATWHRYWPGCAAHAPHLSRVRYARASQPAPPP